MASPIARLDREPAFARELADGGRLRVERHFDEARSHQRLHEEIARLIAARRRGESVAADPALLPR
jgi:hypothetical protein